MTTIQIPEQLDLRKRLDGIDRLLHATKWERAAIVYAYSVPQTNKGHGNRPGIAPPQMNIRDFAAQGYKGLTTPKAVARYRDAWVMAMENGWAGEAVVGQAVELPDEWPFPPWDGRNVWEDVTPKRYRSPARPIEERVLATLDSAAGALRRLADAMVDEPLNRETRDELVTRLTELRDEADAALDALGVVRA